MYKYLFSFLICCFLSNAQNITFSDANFKNALINTICVNNDSNPGADIDADINNDGEIDVAEALLVEHLIIDNRNISNINEISYFLNLQSLACNNNQLTSLSFVNNNTLRSLTCQNNLINSLTLVNLPNLSYLICSDNLFTTIDLSTTGFVEGSFSNNPNLETIQLKNGITNLCLILLMQGVDYTCAMFLNCPALRLVCLDQQDLDSSLYYSSSPQNLVTFNTNSNCTLSSEDFESNSLKIYPNPFNEHLSLTSELNVIIEKVTIYNSLGQTVFQNTSNFENIDVSQLKKGYYFIEILTDKGKKIEKIMKQ